MAGVAVQPLAYIDQADFSAGAHPGLEVIPPNGAEYIVNGVLAQDGSVFRRGGSSYLGTLSATSALAFQNLWSGHVGVLGPVTVVSRREGSPVSTEVFYRMLPGDTDFTATAMRGIIGPVQRPVIFAGMLVYVAVPSGNLPGIAVNAWGGDTGGTSQLAYLTGQSITLTKDSKAVTGAGTTFTSLAPGSIVLDPNVNVAAVVESVQSNTAATLMRPWPGDTRTFNADFYHSLNVVVSKGPLTAGSQEVYAASLFERMVYARGSRVSFTPGGNPFATTDTDYHEVPGGSSVIGLEPLRDLMAVFTTDGVYAISGLGLDLTDDFGNPQQRLEHIDPELVLWDNRGIASWEGAIVVPAVDDVFLLDGLSAPRPIGGGMRRLYRSYVRAGYRAGLATVYRGLYFLPVLNNTPVPANDSWVDTLVCDLQTGAWTQWAGHGGTLRGVTDVVADSQRAPRLFAIGSGASPRVLDLSTSTEPQLSGSGTDADGSSYDMTVTTRTLTLRDLVPDTWRRFRARLEGTSTSPSVALAYATGKPGSSFLSVSSPQIKTEDNEQIYSWHFNERTRAIRFRLTVHSGGSREVLRSVHAGGRVSGHHRP